jgi:hypothetical protein
MISSSLRPALLTLLGIAAACRPADLGPDPMVPAPVSLALKTNRPAPATGDTLSLLLEVRATASLPVTALQGELRFDPRALRFLGQPLAGRAMVVVNERAAADGRLRFLALDIAGLVEIPVDLRFEALRPGAVREVRFTLEEAVLGVDLITTSGAIAPGLTLGASPLAAAATRRLTAVDWIRYLGDDTYLTAKAVRLPGDGRIYGDANLSQTITGGDVVSIANVAVGNLPLFTDINRDYAVAGNVSPPNSPGLGESDDPIPPGRNADGTWTITGGDAVAIANEAVGNDLPVPGSLIPGRGPPTSRSPSRPAPASKATCSPAAAW